MKTLWEGMVNKGLNFADFVRFRLQLKHALNNLFCPYGRQLNPIEKTKVDFKKYYFYDQKGFKFL